MKRLIGLGLGVAWVLASQSAEPQALSEREAVALVHAINAAQGEAFFKKDSYLSLEQLIKSARAHAAMARAVTDSPIVQSDSTTGSIRDYKLSVMPSIDGKHYAVSLVPEPATRCGPAFFSGDAEGIFSGRSQSCEGK